MRLFACGSVLLASALAHAQPAPPDPQPPGGGSDSTPGAQPGTAQPAPITQPEVPPAHAPAAPREPVTPESPPAATAAVKPDLPAGEDWSFRPGGFIQPEFRTRQDSPGIDDTDGYKLVRARFTGTCTGHIGELDLGCYFEAELQPAFSLYDAYVTASHTFPSKLTLSFDAGQMRVPISRQQLISDTRRSFTEGAQLTSIAPDRDLGIRLTAAIPHVRVIFGSFNGEGRDQGQNINESYFTAGRVEITPIGEQAPYAESAFGGPYVSFAASVGYDKLTPGAYYENETFIGYDVSGAWHGLSGSFEYLQVKHHFSEPRDGATLMDDYLANGFVVQAAYLLPIQLMPARAGRLEIGARIDEIDRNDVTPIVMPGDPNQTLRASSAVVTYYLKEHRLKLQAEATHFQELETLTVTGQNATYPSDQILVMLTYRVE